MVRGLRGAGRGGRVQLPRCTGPGPRTAVRGLRRKYSDQHIAQHWATTAAANTPAAAYLFTLAAPIWRRFNTSTPTLSPRDFVPAPTRSTHSRKIRIDFTMTLSLRCQLGVQGYLQQCQHKNIKPKYLPIHFELII